jgi:hypothetical protein
VCGKELNGAREYRNKDKEGREDRKKLRKEEGKKVREQMK